MYRLIGTTPQNTYCMQEQGYMANQIKTTLTDDIFVFRITAANNLFIIPSNIFHGPCCSMKVRVILTGDQRCLTAFDSISITIVES